MAGYVDDTHYPRIVSRGHHTDSGLTYQVETLEYDTEEEATGGAASYRARGLHVADGGKQTDGGWTIKVQQDGTTPQEKYEPAVLDSTDEPGEG